MSQWNYNFSLLNAADLQEQGNITHREIIYVVENEYSKLRPIIGYPASDYLYYYIGCSNQSRFFKIAFQYLDNQLIFLQVELASEEEVRSEYCITC